MPDTSRKYLDATTLSKIGRLEMRARLVVEGFISGLHKSPYHGFSVEFAQHREYSFGDDLKHLDWKVLGRTGRLYIKQYEEETNLRCHMLLDTSESMAYGGVKRRSKLEYACYLVASLTHLLLRQQDAAGLTLFDSAIRRTVPASASPAQMRAILTELATITPHERTDMSGIFHELAERVKRRGLVVLVSDLFDSAENILQGLAHFRHSRHEVVVFHVLDRDELTFPFKELTRFEGLEEFPELMTDPRSLRQAYLAEVESFVSRIKRGCLNRRIDYVQLDTSTPLDVALAAYLATRASTRTK